MKNITFILFILSFTFSSYGQIGKVIENKVTIFSIEEQKDTINFIVIDTLLNEKKPLFLWCQGSLPIPLFCEIENYGNYFFGGGISNFNYEEISKNYHLVVISMPKTPVVAKKENINKQYQFVPNIEKPNEYSPEYINANYLENYVNRANTVLNFLNNKDWVDTTKLIIAGHSQGTKVATKIALNNKSVTHLGLFSANPFGRIDQMIRTARLNAQLGKISWVEADSTMNRYYQLYKDANNIDSLKVNPGLIAWKTFSETYYDDWLQLNIPIYLAYGTEDRTADLCDLMPLFFIEQGKNNLTLKRYIGLEHNFFETIENGRTNHEKGHWKQVMNEFLKWIK